VDVEVHGTQVELVAVSAGSESGWRRSALAMRVQGRNKMVPCCAWLALSGGLDVGKSHEVDQASSSIRVWWRQPWQAERGTRQSRGGMKWGLASPFDVKATDKGDRVGTRGGGAAWAARGGREEQMARGGAAAGAIRADGGAVSFAVTRGGRARKK
jgi:hypothetical protein